MAAKKKAKAPEPKSVDVRSIIRVDMIIDEPDQKASTVGWVHTHGMWEAFALPDLEILGVRPNFLMPEAGRILNHVAQYMVDGMMGINGAKPIKLGETFGLNRLQIMRIEESMALDEADAAEVATHYSTPRWRLTPIDFAVCQECGKKHAKNELH